MSRKIVVHTLPEFFFEANANSPEYWQRVAYELIGSANMCLQRYRRFGRRNYTHPTLPPAASFRVSMMLYAFGLEGLLKSLWLAQGARRATTVAGNTRQLNNEFRKHDLTLWWQRTSLPTPTALHEEVHEEVLRFLTMHTELGRYPVRAKPHSQHRLAIGRDIKAVILTLLSAVDQEIRRLRPRAMQNVRLGSIGVRSSQVAQKRGASR